MNTGAGTGSNTYQNTDNSVVNIQASINWIGGGSISCYGIDTNGLATTRQQSNCGTIETRQEKKPNQKVQSENPKILNNSDQN